MENQKGLSIGSKELQKVMIYSVMDLAIFANLSFLDMFLLILRLQLMCFD